MGFFSEARKTDLRRGHLKNNNIQNSSGFAPSWRLGVLAVNSGYSLIPRLKRTVFAEDFLDELVRRMVRPFLDNDLMAAEGR